MKKYWIVASLFISLQGFTQDVDKKIYNWYNGKKYGMHTDLAYKKVLSEKQSTTVIVAVIDSGVDVEHEDLKGKIWVNADEIPDNGIDDDNNGYIDDVHGWNFLGNADGENINDVQLEVTRIYARLDKIYKGRTFEQLEDDEKADFALYKECKKIVEDTRKESKKELDGLTEANEIFAEADSKLRTHFGGDYTAKDLKKAKKSPFLGTYAEQISALASLGLSYDDFKGIVDYYQDNLDFNYNPDIDPRGDVVGDDVTDFSDTKYGNNDVEGPDAGHGTHVAGIIAANRGNDMGNDGIADNVKIMSLRAVPNGDEWDKDIALAIRYAVDNGASVINMSFGKSYSPEQEGVIEAFRYAESKGVLCVHAAGNDGQDNDNASNFPTPKYDSMSSKFTNWIEVGASTRHKKAKYFKKTFLIRDGLAADFSNYGDEMVDVFAPGHDIYSTVPQSDYDIYDGTSMAGPMVAGVAALLKSYYPSLTMFQIRDIIFKSVQKPGDRTTPLPGDASQQVTFAALCTQEGIVNVYNAVEMAEEMTP